MNKKVFTRKPYVGTLYKWSPDSNAVTKGKANKNVSPYYCNATTSSQGEDNIIGYVYEIVVVNGQATKLAYVACDYVQ